MKSAFTLVELLVVIFIIAILVSLVVGVATYVMDESAIKETEITQAMTMVVLNSFYELYNKYPADREDPSGSYDTDDSSRVLLKYLTGILEDDDDLEYLTGQPTSTQAERDAEGKKIRDALSDSLLKLPEDAFIAGSPSRILDGWGKDMRYQKDGGFGGTPVLISDGPDQSYPSDDDIRSDGR